MKRRSTIFLKAALLLIGIPIFALCLLLLPQLAYAISKASEGSTLGFIITGILVITYTAAVPFYIAIYQTFKLLTYIDKNQAFSDLSVKALKIIKKCAIIISCLYVAALPLIFIVAEWDDAPGLVLIGLIITGASLVIAVFAAVLLRLLRQVLDIKSENDLTV